MTEPTPVDPSRGSEMASEPTAVDAAYGAWPAPTADSSSWPPHTAELAMPPASLYPPNPPPAAPPGALGTWGYGPPPSRQGQVGKIRGTGSCILLCIVTFGIYSLVWFYQVHDEMKRYSGEGVGGGIALLFSLLFGVVTPYLTSSEVGNLYAARGMRKPVSGATGLWNFPGAFILVGPIIWFVKTNGALNAYWRAHGAVG